MAISIDALRRAGSAVCAPFALTVGLTLAMPANAQSGCAAAMPDFQAALRANTAEALAEYLGQHAPCFEVPARARLDALGGAPVAGPADATRWDWTRKNDIAPGTGWVTSLAFSPDGRMLATGDRMNLVKLWDLSTSRSVWSKRSDGERSVLGLAFSPDGRLLATSSYEDGGAIHLRDVATGNIVRTIASGQSYVADLAFSPDGETLAAAARGQVQLWSPLSGELIARRALDGTVQDVEFTSDGGRIAAGVEGAERTFLLRGSDLAMQTSFEGDGSNEMVALSPDATKLAIGHDGRLELFDVATGTGEEIAFVRTGNFVPSWEGAAFTPDGSLLVAAQMDGSLLFYDVANGTTLPKVTGNRGTFRSFAMSPDGRTIAVGTDDSTALIFRATEPGG